MIHASQASFNVRATDDAVCVTCVRGNLIVKANDRIAKLNGGEEVLYASRQWSGIRPANLELATAWRAGVVVFHDLALSAVVHEINRYRPGEILITDSRLGTRRFSGFIQIKSPEAILAQLRSLGIRVTVLPAGIAIVS